MKKRSFFFLYLSAVILSFFYTSVSGQVTIPPSEREYVIGTGDRLDIRVWQIPELSSKASVRLDGKITLPRLGDVQAAGLKISSLKNFLAGEEEGKETIGKYVEDPNITITLIDSSGTIRITLGGAVSQTVEVPRQLTLVQMIEQLASGESTQQSLNLEGIRITSAEGEVFLVNGNDLLAGRKQDMNFRLEWGDEIYIPSIELPPPTPIPEPVSTPSAAAPIVYTEEELQELLQAYPDKLEIVRDTATLRDDGKFSFKPEEMTEEEKAAIGDELLEILLGGIQTLPREFTKIELAGISVNLTFHETLEAYLLFPAITPEELPTIQRFRKGELVEKGITQEEDIYLEEIQDWNKQVILRKGGSFQEVPLLPSFSEAKLAGVLNIGNTKKAFFSNVNLSPRKQIKKRTGFQENDEIKDGIVLAKIDENNQWGLLKKDDEFQLVLLRDSLSRVVTATRHSPERQTDLPTEDSASGPVIDIWYGPYQVFGQLGIPQFWVNIFGNVSDNDGVASLTYSLNGEEEKELRIGPRFRLVGKGDFNVELSYAEDLISGINEIILTAKDTLGNQSSKTVEVEYISGNSWPLPYTIDWSQVQNIQDVAQIADGYWSLEDDTIRTIRPGYDRLIAIGDLSWRDYEVTVSRVTVHSMNLDAGIPPAIGIILRWEGHRDVFHEKPRRGWLPTGAVGWYKPKPQEHLELEGGRTALLLQDDDFTLKLGVPYVFKMRVETILAGARYSFKVWEEDAPEPSDWDLVGEEDATDPQNGSVLLVAHETDVSFGSISIIPLTEAPE